MFLTRSVQVKYEDEPQAKTHMVKVSTKLYYCYALMLTLWHFNVDAYSLPLSRRRTDMPLALTIFKLPKISLCAWMSFGSPRFKLAKNLMPLCKTVSVTTVSCLWTPHHLFLFWRLNGTTGVSIGRPDEKPRTKYLWNGTTCIPLAFVILCVSSLSSRETLSSGQILVSRCCRQRITSADWNWRIKNWKNVNGLATHLVKSTNWSNIWEDWTLREWKI